MNSFIFFLFLQMTYLQVNLPATMRCDENDKVEHCIRDLFEKSNSPSVKLDNILNVRSRGCKTYIATNAENSNEGDRCIYAYIFDSIARFTYAVHLLDTFYFLPATPKLLLAFNANADADRDNELILLCSWSSDDINFRGYTYQVFIYDYPKTSNGTFHLQERSFTLFPRESEALRQGERLRAKYNTEAKIRRRLKQLGYTQYSN